MFAPSPLPSVPGLYNLRDLGGHSIQPSSSSSSSSSPSIIRTGIILRSAAPPPSPSPTTLIALTSLNISRTYDLRSGVEIERHHQDPTSPFAWHHPPSHNGPIRVRAPVFADQDYGPEAIPVRFAAYASKNAVNGFLMAYKSILEAGGPAYAAILKHLAGDEPLLDDGANKELPAPMLIHCSAGKDRTGIICAIILAICGVDDDTIAKEYALTEQGLAEIRPTMLANILKVPSMMNDPEGAERMLGSK